MKNELEVTYYKIGQISKICNIPIRTLHHYDDIDLLKPAKVDSDNNYRYYSHDQLLEINMIKYFKMAGFSLNHIKKLLERNDLEYSQQMIKCKCEEIETNITNIVEKNDLQMTGTMMAVFYDDYREFDYSQADIEVCVAVEENRECVNVVRKFGGFLGAVAYHYGSYTTTNQTYKKMLDWLEDNNLAYVGGAIENYIIDAITTSCVDDYITEIILPVQKIIN